MRLVRVSLVLVVVALLMVGCNTPTTPTPTLPPATEYQWHMAAPGCDPRRPLPVRPTVAPQSVEVEGNAVYVFYVRPDDLLFVTFIRVTPQVLAICEWDTSDN